MKETEPETKKVVTTQAPVVSSTESKANGAKPKAEGEEEEKLDYYFDSYSHFGIHEEMLKDSVRTETYRNAILNNPQLFKDKVVLDIGCGTGILCLFAAQAGAKKVYGIECASIAKHAKNIVKANGYRDTIEIIRGKVEEIELPIDKVDVIVSEWMGYFMLYESMLDTVLFARDKWLKKDTGILMPDRGTLYFGALEDQDYKLEKVGFWSNVYGFDMSCVKEDVINEPLVDCVEQEKVCSVYTPVLDVNLYTVKTGDLDFSTKVKLPIFRNDYVHALVAFFTVEFSKCHKPVGFSTGPHANYTHWKQTVFYLTTDLMVKKQTEMEMDLSVSRNKKNPRDLDVRIKIDYEGTSQLRNYAMR